MLRKNSSDCPLFQNVYRQLFRKVRFSIPLRSTLVFQEDGVSDESKKERSDGIAFLEFTTQTRFNLLYVLSS
jgi:hypothetical protein